MTPGHFHEEGGFRSLGNKQKFYLGPIPEGYVFDSGDMVVAMTEQADGLLGSAALVPDDGRYLHNQRLGRIKILSDSIDLLFLYYVFNSPTYRRSVHETAAGTKVKHTSPAKLLEIAVSLPPLPEQRAIGSALSDVDKLIDALDKLIAKKRSIKLATTQQLLTGKTRLPGFSDEWSPVTMGSIGSTYGGLSGKTKSDFGRGDDRYITFLNVLENVIVDTNLLEPVNVSPGESQNSVRAGDILFNGTSETPGDLAMGSVVKTSQSNIYLNSFCFGFRLYDVHAHIHEFSAYTFRSHVGRTLMFALAQGATRYNMSKKQFLNLELQLPNRNEQNAIVHILSDMEDGITTLEQRRDKTKSIKQGMMQTLLTGRVRLVEPEGAS